MHRIISTHASHYVLTVVWHIFIRVDAANEVAYELIAEPVQEPQAEEQQEDALCFELCRLYLKLLYKTCVVN